MKSRTLVKMAFIGVLTLGATSCEVVELDNPEIEAALQSEPEPEEHVIPSTVPMDEAELLQYLTDGDTKSWNAASFTLESIDGFQQCRLDDTFVFDIDGTYVYDGGSTLCGAEDNTATRTGNWVIAMDNLQLTIDQGSPNEFSAEIIGFVENRIALKTAYMGLEVIGVYDAN